MKKLVLFISMLVLPSIGFSVTNLAACSKTIKQSKSVVLSCSVGQVGYRPRGKLCKASFRCKKPSDLSSVSKTIPSSLDFKIGADLYVTEDGLVREH